MQPRKLALLAALATAGAFAACTLNPQPLPPSDNEASNFGDDASVARSDGGSFDPETPPNADAGTVPTDGDGGDGGGDGGGDAGDGGGDAGDGGDGG